MMYRFSSFVLALLLLVASGQASAAAFASKTATPSLITLAGADWGVDAADCATTVGTSPTTPGNGDTYTLCGTGLHSTRALVAITTLTGISPITGLVTIQTGASVTASGDIAFGGSVTNNGTLVVSGTNKLTMPASSTLTNGGTLTLGTATTAHALVNLTTSAGGTTTLGNAAISGNLVVSAGTLALTSANTVAGNVTLTSTGAISGTLALTDTNHSIAIPAAMTIPALDLSAITMSTAKTVTFSGAYDVTISSLKLPSAATSVKLIAANSQKIIISAVNGGNISSCTDGTTTVQGATLPITLTMASSAAAYICTFAAAAPIEAPVLSTGGKAKVFAEEAK